MILRAGGVCAGKKEHKYNKNIRKMYDRITFGMIRRQVEWYNNKNIM